MKMHRTSFLLMLISGVGLLAWVFITPGEQALPAFVGGYITVTGLIGLAISRRK